jgi:hypothetical protein
LSRRVSTRKASTSCERDYGFPRQAVSLVEHIPLAPKSTAGCANDIRVIHINGKDHTVHNECLMIKSANKSSFELFSRLVGRLTNG